MTSSIDDILAGYESLRPARRPSTRTCTSKAVAPLMEAALRRLAEATPGSAELLRLMDATPVPCGASAVTARRSGLYGYRRVPGWISTPTSSTYTREPSYLAGRLSALDARLEDAHMGCSMQTKAWASDADQGIGQ